ncbi:hypothetical protein GFS31_07220 [Leptolyngbya sp. BL0902]|uniref:hypothetical protein n=1 Tax=Leptolyngbya sp. BL0902 TaxID=1115757 RepID=UPI0018E8DA39|nr:hypothetical protein [Leptolyngbya sp. BL0902]QQE64050.1 hypothetical protein GFS31_07220 [Leptolyngbya sp. BL0902]
MSLSLCSQCKNYSEEVCLLGQSYVDVFGTIQTIVDDQDRQRLTSYLASCAYWEESDLSKLFSQDVTLSYHAWSRLAYMKIHNGDQELFQNLIKAARTVMVQQRQMTDPVGQDQPTPSELLTPSPSQSPEPDALEPEAAALEDPQPTPLEDPQPIPLEDLAEDTAMTSGEEPIALPPLVEVPPVESLSSLVVAEVGSSSPTSVMPLPAPVALPSAPPAFHPEVTGQPGVPVATQPGADPIEVAMQELWTMATSGHLHHGQGLGTMADANRGTGRIDPLTR